MSVPRRQPSWSPEPFAVARRPAAGPASRPVVRRRSSRAGRVRTRLRRVFALTLLILLGASGLSLLGAVARPSNSPLGVRVVEWLRDNGGAGLVSSIEGVYYSWSAPSTGGPALHRLPAVGIGAAPSVGVRPAPIAPVISPPLPGEGVWRGTGPLVRGAPGVLVTTLRPDPAYPQMVAGVAWIDSTRAWLQLYPGRYEPPDSGNPIAEVPPSLRGSVLATFNSGFKLEDDHGGFVAFRHVYAPLVDGQATLLRTVSGAVDIRTWTGGPTPPPNIEFARQNLPLIVDAGRLNPSLGDGALWGQTLGNAVRVWRSGAGVDAHGNLIYAAANEQTAASLAAILQRAGAVRAMELDINSEWTTFNFYDRWGGAGPEKLLPDMNRDATRYLSPDDRDFFAVYARHGT